MSNYKIINSRNIFIITLVVISITILSVWIFGLGVHNSLFKNSLISTTILSFAFFLFISIGLFKGIKIKDNIGKITDRFNKEDVNFVGDIFLESDSSPDHDFSDGIFGVIISLVLWFIMAVAISYLAWAFGAVIWFSVLAFTAMLYWIFFSCIEACFQKISYL